MKYIKIKKLLEDTNIDNFQSYLQKLEFSKNFYKNLNELTEEELIILDEDCWNVLNDKISEKELEYQYNRYILGYETRNYKEVSVMFQINKLFERLILIFMNRKYNLNLKVNPRSYSYINSSVDPDFITLDDKIYYDLEGRTLNENNKIVIQFLEHKIKRNYLIHIQQNKQYYVIKYFIQKAKLKIGLININELYQKNLFYTSGEHTKDGETVYRINKEITLDTYDLKNNKIMKGSNNNMITRTEFNQFEYNDIKQFINENVKIEDVLNHFGYNILNTKRFNCIFHNDSNPSASISQNKYCCWAGCLNNFSHPSYLNVIELYSLLSNKDIHTQIWDIMFELYNLSFLDYTTSNIQKKQNENKFEYEKDYYDKVERYEKSKNSFHTHLSEEETYQEYKNCHKYLELRGIDNQEKLMKILERNHIRIGTKYFCDENHFYVDFGYQDGNKGTCICRKINDYINTIKYNEKIKEIDKWNKENSNKKQYTKVYCNGFLKYYVLKTSSKNYYIDEKGIKQAKKIVIFEGHMDCFSFIDLSTDIEKYTLVILNSVSMSKRLIQDIISSLENEKNSNDLLSSNSYLVCTDTDEAGKSCFNDICTNLKNYDEDIDVEYFDYSYGIEKQVKDMNEYCIELKKVLDKQKEKK